MRRGRKEEKEEEAGEEEEEGAGASYRFVMWHGSVCASGGNASQLSGVQDQASGAALCCGPLCSTGPAGDNNTAGLCGWIVPSCYNQTKHLNYILNWQFTCALETTVHTPRNSPLPSFSPLRFLTFHFLVSCIIFGLPSTTFCFAVSPPTMSLMKMEHKNQAIAG